jgi:hypothetical protein
VSSSSSIVPLFLHVRCKAGGSGNLPDGESASRVQSHRRRRFFWRLGDGCGNCWRGLDFLGHKMVGPTVSTTLFLNAGRGALGDSLSA